MVPVLGTLLHLTETRRGSAMTSTFRNTQEKFGLAEALADRVRVTRDSETAMNAYN